MGLKWDIDHMQKGFFINEFGEILEVKNVFFENGKIDISKIIKKQANIKKKQHREYTNRLRKTYKRR